MRKTLKVLMLALDCSAFCWADCHTLDLSVVIAKDFMVIGARGGFSPNIFYTTLSDRYGTRYVTLHRESADDPGRIVWALYSEKDGLLDSVIVDKKHRMYKAVGLGEGGIMPSQDELKKHKRCSCVPGAALEGTPATPYSRGVLEILKGVGKSQNK